MNAEIIGYVATFASITSLLPQVWKSWKTRSTKDVSLSMYLVFGISQLLWFIYGLLIASWPLVATNLTNLLLSLFIILMKVRYG